MDQPGPDLFVVACLLMLLREQPGTRTDLARRMRAFGVSGRTVGHVLRTLERAGLVRSAWHPFSAASPPWRRYCITGRGVGRLARYARTLHAVHVAMHALVDQDVE